MLTILTTSLVQNVAIFYFFIYFIFIFLFFAADYWIERKERKSLIYELGSSVYQMLIYNYGNIFAQFSDKLCKSVLGLLHSVC